jgi:hypothetical protein
MKKPWLSKTLWVNFLIAGLVLAIPGMEEFIKSNDTVVIVATTLVNIALRLITKEELKL